MAQPTRLGFVGGGGGWGLGLVDFAALGKLGEYGAAYSPGIRGRRRWGLDWGAVAFDALGKLGE